MTKRIIFDVLLLISAFIFPWWVVTLAALAGVFIFPNFYEFILIEIILYSLYIIPDSKLIISPVFFTLIISLIYILIQILRRYIIFYKN